jgi:DNA-binding PadR family transcriptional regulator
MEKSDTNRTSDPALLILASLSDEPRHGYAIMDEVLQTSGTRLGPGTLYTALNRLERRGLIEHAEGQSRRRPYRLTQAGRAWLRARMTQLLELAASTLDRLGTELAPPTVLEMDRARPGPNHRKPTR